MKLYKGDIYYADLSPVIGSEQGGIRPVLIIQNDIGNRYSPTVIIASITSRLDKHRLPTHVSFQAQKYGLPRNSIVLLEQIRTIDRIRLNEYIGHMDSVEMQFVEDALLVSLGIEPIFYDESIVVKNY
ncbi:type II toxin-antitoxin system PemK/MazF family toxin [Hungatella hathewayi]|uniref:type II toxin-antitoxin system PemK/MazF family toxin n=1 Tax=Hungatella hathewayi TaxID=154046 RepID=UPI0035678E30